MEHNKKFLKINNQIGGWTVQNYKQGTNYINIMGMSKNTTLEHLRLFLIDRRFIFDNISQSNNIFTIRFSSPDIASKSRSQLINVLDGINLGLPAYNPYYIKSDMSLSVPVPASNKITIVENGLKEFGLKKISLVGNYSINNYFDMIIKDLDNLSDYIDEFIPFTDGYTLKHKGLYGSYYEKNYIVGSSAGRGYWNETFTCTDGKGKEFILKKTNYPTMKGEKQSFYENMKHLILYILIRKFIGKLKFIPQMYHLGILKESKDKIAIICIMEKGGVILGDYINTVTFIDNQKLFLKIYNSLFIIEDKLKINFKHNDFKENNILVSSDGKPMLIDFGFCEFKIDTISFHSLNVMKPHENFDSTTYFGYNIIHDMIQLMTSLYYSSGATICPYKIFKFVKNDNTNILDTDILIRYLTSKFPSTYTNKKGTFYKPENLLVEINRLLPDDLAYLKNIFYTFYDKGNYNLVDDKVKIPMLVDKSIFIKPTELADNIGIPLPSEDDSFGNFEKKYKKYKMKYLKLKNSY